MNDKAGPVIIGANKQMAICLNEWKTQKVNIATIETF